MSTKEKVEFKAEVSQVLNIVINSLYSHREVFLRELISNAADAIDKRKHLTLTGDLAKEEEEKYSIRLVPNKEEKTLKIIDNGIGMNREEAINNLGTIASSGTRAFIEQLNANKDQNIDLIGQFGVGFYSAFMVSKSVKVETKKVGEEGKGICWISDGSGGYTLEEIDKDISGTEITLSLKDDAVEFLDEYQIKNVVKKYSDYVSYPILLKNEKDEEETINKVTAIWRRPKSEIKDEEYNEFYKYVSHDFEDPLAFCHHTIEGALEFRMLLFVPKRAPANFYREDIHGLRLHVKKMFISDQCKELLPVYLRFVKGVVDSEDLPLNISRETLQQDAVIPKMRKQLTKKILDLFEDLEKKDPGKYREFFKELGIAFKEGITMDFDNKDRLIDLLRFQSTQGKSADEMTSLNDYVLRMKPDQKEIFYLTGPTREACEKSPHLEFFRKKELEVLFMVDMVDEWSTPAIGEYKGKKLKSISQGDLDLGDLTEEDKKEKEKADVDLKDLKDRVRAALQDEVKEVRLSLRLSESPCCLVSDDGDVGVNMEQIMKAMGKDVPVMKRILELNPEHAIVKNMQTALQKNPKDERIDQWAVVLYHQALLAEGIEIKDASSFIKGVSDLLTQVTGQS